MQVKRGGALINQGQHILDMYQYLFECHRNFLQPIPFGKYNDFIVDDEATIVMEYDNGKTGTFILSTGEACHEERLEIIGTKRKNSSGRRHAHHYKTQRCM